MRPKRISVRFPRKRSTSWATPSVGAMRRKPEGPIWVPDRPERKCRNSADRSAHSPIESRSGWTPRNWLDVSTVVFAAGPTISVWEQSAKPTVPWNDTPRVGSASGCVASIKYRVREPHASPTSTCTKPWDWFGLPACLAAIPSESVSKPYPTILVREPDAGKPPVRFDEREVETELRPPRHLSTLPITAGWGHSTLVAELAKVPPTAPGDRNSGEFRYTRVSSNVKRFQSVP